MVVYIYLDLFYIVPGPKSIDGQGIKFVLKFWSSLTDLIQHEPTKFASFLSIFLPMWLKISKEKNDLDLFFCSWWPNKICRPRYCYPVHLFSKTVLVQNERNIFELVPIISNWTKNYFLLQTFAFWAMFKKFWYSPKQFGPFKFVKDQ